MDYQLNMKNIPSASSSSTTTKRSFHGRKLQYQERIGDQPTLSPPITTTLSPTYLTADDAWKTVAMIESLKLDDGQKQQVEIEG